MSLFAWLRWPSTETTEWFCLRSATWWVLTLTPALHLFAVNSNFSGLAQLGNEGVWQAVLGVLLFGQVLAVCLGNVWARLAALFAFGTVWAAITGLLWAGAPHAWGWAPVSTGLGPYASLSADCYIVGIHLVRRWYIDHLAEQERAAIRAAAAQAQTAQGEGGTTGTGGSTCPHG